MLAANQQHARLLLLGDDDDVNGDAGARVFVGELVFRHGSRDGSRNRCAHPGACMDYIKRRTPEMPTTARPSRIKTPTHIGALARMPASAADLPASAELRKNITSAITSLMPNNK